MPHSIVMEQSRAIPVTPDDAFTKTMPMHLPTLFNRWYGPIPPIKATLGQTGDWSSVGETRNVVLAGGGGMRERLTTVDAPRSFGYTLTDLQGPLSPLIDHIDGLWSFEPCGTGTRVNWRWTVFAKSALTAPVLPVFAALWRGYASNSLETLSDYLVD